MYDGDGGGGGGGDGGIQHRESIDLIFHTKCTEALEVAPNECNIWNLDRDRQRARD